MNLLDAILLGVIQGLTEFLPVSSDGHLALAEQWLGWTQEPLTMTVILHAGTLGVVVAYFRKELGQAVVGALRAIAAVARGRAGKVLAEDPGARLALMVVIATIPTGIIGLALEHPTETLAQNPVAVAGFLALSGVFVLATRFFARGERSVSVGAALAIGIVQGLAVLPGLSRSATTISVALGLKVQREEAARFSFLASVPAITGAVLLKTIEALRTHLDQPLIYVAGVIVSALTGWFAVRLLTRLVKGGHFWWFALYLFPFAAAVGIYSLVTR
jgi:undecaprenyl-diphosphatase